MIPTYFVFGKMSGESERMGRETHKGVDCRLSKRRAHNHLSTALAFLRSYNAVVENLRSGLGLGHNLFEEGIGS